MEECQNLKAGIQRHKAFNKEKVIKGYLNDIKAHTAEIER